MNFRLDRPALYLITNGTATAENFDADLNSILKAISAAVEENVQLVQIREKQLDTRRLFELVKNAVAITRGSSTRLLVNDRADVAAAASADGVHLTSRSMPISEVKKSFPDLVIGISTHTPDETARARIDGADLALFGPIFETPGKGKPGGIAALRNICDEAGRFPVLVIGGIGEGNFQSVLRAGAAGFGAIRSLNDREELHRIVKSLR